MDKPLQTPGCSNFPCLSVLELPPLERILLWSVRTWAAYHDAPQAIRDALQRVFVDAGIPQALSPFAELMTALFCSEHRLPDIRCVRCLHLGKDECELLAVMTAMPGNEHLIRARLARLMSSVAVRNGTAAVLQMMQVIGQPGRGLQATCVPADLPVWPPPCQQFIAARH